MKTVWLLTAAAAAVAGGLWYWGHRTEEAPTYVTSIVERGDLTQIVTATGQLNPVLNVQVGSQVSGNISKLFADWNSPVKAGQVVAQIDPADFQANVLQAQGDLESAKAALELAQVVAKRTQDLRDKDGTPQATLDQAMANLHQAQALIKVKQGALDKATVDLEHCTIYSPISGIVISRSVDVGQTVAAGFSAPIIFLIANDLANMQIDSSVAEADVGNVQVGQDVDFTVDAYPYRTFHGKVTQVRNSPTTVQNVVTYDVVISVQNADLKLKPGMTANLSIIIVQRQNVLTVGNSALRYRPADDPKAAPSAAMLASRASHLEKGQSERHFEKTVYVLGDAKDEKPAPVKIQIGITDGISTEVVSGVKEGDKVVIAQMGTGTQALQANPFGGPRRF
jgi:HlyD family secretion protein